MEARALGYAGLCWAMLGYAGLILGISLESPWNPVWRFRTVRKKEQSFPITCCSGEAHRQLLMVVSAHAKNSGGLFLPSGFFPKAKK